MNNISIILENNKIFKVSDFNDMSSETIFNFEYSKIERNNKYILSEHLINSTTIEAVLQNYDKGKIIALNFANAIIPGGAYIIGGNAQEESLCRASMLYYTIKTQRKYYIKNIFHFLPSYTDTMIYSKNVQIIRYDDGCLLENPVYCNFITCPAVNKTLARFIMPDKKIIKIMERRINKIISFAMSKSPDVLILGAFGCGAFGNNRETIFKIFENSINSYIDEKPDIIFAVPQ